MNVSNVQSRLISAAPDEIQPDHIAAVADTAIEVELWRMQMRIDHCLDRHGGSTEAATKGSGIGLSLGFANEIVRAFELAEREIWRLRDIIKGGKTL